jgi:hypothetical protein
MSKLQINVPVTQEVVVGQHEGWRLSFDAVRPAFIGRKLKTELVKEHLNELLEEIDSREGEKKRKAVREEIPTWVRAVHTYTGVMVHGELTSTKRGVVRVRVSGKDEQVVDLPLDTWRLLTKQGEEQQSQYRTMLGAKQDAEISIKDWLSRYTVSSGAAPNLDKLKYSYGNGTSELLALEVEIRKEIRTLLPDIQDPEDN